MLATKPSYCNCKALNQAWRGGKKNSVEFLLFRKCVCWSTRQKGKFGTHSLLSPGIVMTLLKFLFFWMHALKVELICCNFIYLIIYYILMFLLGQISPLLSLSLSMSLYKYLQIVFFFFNKSKRLENKSNDYNPDV